MKLSNGSHFKVKGLNQERTINKLVKSFPIYNFRRETHNFSTFDVDFKNRKKIKKILEENNFLILSISHFGIITRIKNLFSRIGILMGLALCTSVFALQYNLVLKIEANGLEKAQNVEIEKYIGKTLTTRWKSKINTKAIEKDVKANFDYVSAISIAIVGQSLVINLNEKVIPQEMSGQFSPLISQYDGVISKINLVQGTVAVKEGEIVKKGDVLVYPFVIDSQGGRREVEAKAEIFADVWLSSSVVHNDCYLKTERTGRKIVYNEVYFNSLLIYSHKPILYFEEYEIEESKQELSKNLILPFMLKKCVIYETKTYEVHQEFETVKSDLIENARQKALIFLKENEIIKAENFSIKEESGWHQINYVVTISKNIGG